MTFRELPVGAKFRFAGETRDALPMFKVHAGKYTIGSWVHCVRPENRDVEVVRIDPPKENEK